MLGEDAINGLRKALRVSPNNLPLRQTLAETLASLGQHEAAEAEYKLALGLAPDNLKLKIALANVFYQQNKNSHALVIIEDLLKSPDAPARALVLHAKLLVRAGDVNRAVRQYKRAVELDAAAADADFATRLGITAKTQSETDSPSEVVNGKVRQSWEADDGPSEDSVERPKIDFKDVGGMDGLKDEIRMKIIHPLAHADLYKAYGKTIGGGILMYGPPGCGKTHLARATAGEIKSNFISVGINDVLNMWIGNSERNLHQLFEQARRNRPCVLFFDEVDALAASRADMRTSGGRHLINQFLSEMDGVEKSNDGVLILAATNAPWHVDSAFRRPGRFDRILFVPPPDAAARSATLQILLKGKPVQDIDYDHLGKKTTDFSGADLKAVVDVAVENKLKEAMRAGIPQPMTTRDLLTAATQVKASTREWFATARNYALYSNQGGIYDDILKYLKMQPMGAAYDRGLILYRQRRYVQARQEFANELAMPDPFIGTLAMMSLCLSNEKKMREAWRIAESAVASAPDFAFAYYAFAFAAYHSAYARGIGRNSSRHKAYLDRAQIVLREAIRLEPNNAGYYALLSMILLEGNHSVESRQAADDGLAFDPKQEDCLNARVRALLKLMKFDDALTTSAAALAYNPENDTIHCLYGNLLLKLGRFEEAADHFAETLRLNPTDDKARHGLLQCRCAQRGIYRPLIGYALWLERTQKILIPAGLTVAGTLGIVLGFVVADKPDDIPRVAYCFAAVVTGLVVLPALVARPIFLIMLQFDARGRRCLSLDEKLKGAALVLLPFSLPPACALTYAVADGNTLPLVFAFGMTPFITSLFALSVEGKTRRWWVLGWCGSLALEFSLIAFQGSRFNMGAALLVMGFVLVCVLMFCALPKSNFGNAPRKPSRSASAFHLPLLLVCSAAAFPLIGQLPFRMGI